MHIMIPVPVEPGLSRRRRGRARTWRSPTAQSDAVIVGVARRRIVEVVAEVW
jgi:hypothetical protein